MWSYPAIPNAPPLWRVYLRTIKFTRARGARIRTHDTISRVFVTTDVGVAEDEGLLLRGKSFEPVYDLRLLVFLRAFQVFKRERDERGIFNLVVDFPALLF